MPVYQNFDNAIFATGHWVQRFIAVVNDKVVIETKRAYSHRHIDFLTEEESFVCIYRLR